jgi:transcription-repair coupling factor (superfamily II helicase)
VKETLEKVEKGEIDILVGTHRIISNDVKFKRLGLVIIDEEQRFGVRAKEILKKSKEGVDCLTLSATPIPRTLHMSFLGARDMSVISTPPQDRLPIKTAVVEKQDNITKNAILREMNRDGQIFFIHNRVETIHHTAEQLQKLIPNAKIVIAHGQMPPDHVDKVFHTFKNGEADILVATTIVESGIDIPNANTILIDRADCFGMADLYQLRGRVGRWNRRAYAYFLVPRNQVLKEVSAQRLKALLDAGGYGGGMRVAMRDLEIRGAGDILDTKQSGHIPSVGFYLYCKLLKRTIQALQGKAPKVLSDPKIEFPFDARLPREYINEETLRLEFYQRVGDALSNEKAEEILAEMKDRFGEPPEPVMWLYHVTRIRIFAAHNAFTLLKIEGMFMQVEQKKGKTTTSSKKVVGMIEDPQTLEERLVKILKEMQ